MLSNTGAHTITIVSDWGINISGSHLTAGTDIDVHADRNLELQVSQDRYSQNHHSKSSHAGIGVTFSLGSSNGISFNLGAGRGKSQGSVSVGKSKIRSNYQSVQEQSGIYAGDAGFDVYVGGHTALVGGVIAGTQEAAEQDTNRFSTASLSTQDIVNHADYAGSGYNASIGFELGKATQNPKADPNKPQEIANRKPADSMGVGSDKGSASSITVNGQCS